jgi:hypothetical protein
MRWAKAQQLSKLLTIEKFCFKKVNKNKINK